ncbi:class I SAM-dependent methyltransferase [Saccharomonospora xinjiangensis]|uniref:Putative O-methyltransferase n=1 Tax=Saccharomonospora xinjiangensis XJ-54 TaxID=882086 RepID=I0UY23_9PSEU|nr:class I SAM-dependent methyltransferase [Saccharomonospora xinjiangensis]EID52776.1 putative O-methyltransferase [Saccharomonospora xinjiangensis XJ-54]
MTGPRDLTDVTDLTGLSAESAVQLYDRYLDSLLAVRDEQREEHERGLIAQLDDIEAELLYLRIRRLRPARVVEIGALHGWSTMWILRALRDNGEGRLLSMDLLDAAPYTVPRELARRWTFRKGDARTLCRDWVSDVDYLLIDAEHTGRFARWYLSEVMPGLRCGVEVAVHDVFHRRRPLPWSEGAVLLSWLERRRFPQFTASRAAAPDVHERISQFRRKAGLTRPLHRGHRNPMVFFRIGPGAPHGRSH